MGLFGASSSPFDQDVEKVTDEKNTKDDWSLIMDICDRVGTTTTGPKECLRSIMKRLSHKDPHVALQALTLLDACVSNCSTKFHLEIASREFEQQFQSIISLAQRPVREKMMISLKKWSENEFKNDPQLSLIPQLYTKLKHHHEIPSESPVKQHKKSQHSQSKSKSQSGSSSGQREEEDADLAKAIELSLKEAQTSQQSKSIYPQSYTVTTAGNNSSALSKSKDVRKVKALYDFEAAEDNELTFYAGEIVFVLDDTDPNWWEGQNKRGTGLFPSNFVTADLTEETHKEETSKKTVQFSDEVKVESIKSDEEVTEIDEKIIDNALNLIHEADPTGEVEDHADLPNLEDRSLKMGFLIDQELDSIDRRHAELTKLGGELMEALSMYHSLMREPSINPGYNMGLGAPPMAPPPMHGIPPQMAMRNFQNPSYQYPVPPGPFPNENMMRPPGAMPNVHPNLPYNSVPSSSQPPQVVNSQPNPVAGVEPNAIPNNPVPGAIATSVPQTQNSDMYSIPQQGMWVPNMPPNVPHMMSQGPAGIPQQIPGPPVVNTGIQYNQ